MLVKPSENEVKKQSKLSESFGASGDDVRIVAMHESDFESAIEYLEAGKAKVSEEKVMTPVGSFKVSGLYFDEKDIPSDEIAVSAFNFTKNVDLGW